MSYDLRIAVRVADANEELYAVIAEPQYSNPTYNLGLMFRACTGWNFEQGKFYRVSEVYHLIERGINELTYNEEKYLALNPKNGWGDTQCALKSLEALKSCIDHLEKPNDWEGDKWNRFPKSCLWVAW